MIRSNLIIFFLLFTSTYLYASEIKYLAYQQVDTDRYPNIQDEKEFDLGRYRSQDGIGICYSFTFIKKLEHLCKTTNHCDLKGSELNALHLYKIIHGGIPPERMSQSGHTKMVIDKLNEIGTPYTFYKESCAPFEQLIYKQITNIDPKTGRYWYQEDQQQGLIKLEKQFQAAKDCIDCIPQIAKEIKTDFKNIKATTDHIELVLKKAISADFKVFSDVLLFNLNCRDASNEIKIKPFKTMYGATKKYNTIAKRIELVESLLDKNITPELTVCNSPKDSSGQRICSGHKILLNGKRKRCNNEGKCRIEFKVFNSWGKSWQDENNDGWVDGENLFNYVSRKPVNETDTVPRHPTNSNIMFVEWFEAN